MNIFFNMNLNVTVFTGILLVCQIPALEAQDLSSKSSDFNFASPSIRRGIELRDHGEWANALQEFHREQELILGKGDKGAVAAGRLFKLGRLQMDLNGPGVNPEVREKAIDGARKSFEQAILLDDPPISAMARVHLAGISLQRSDPADALRLLKECDRSQFDASQLTVLDYNIGRALQEQKKTGEAAETFRNVLKANPQFGPAADRLIDIAISSGPDGQGPDREQISRLAEEFLRSGSTERAAKLARETIRVQGGAWSDILVQDAVGVLCRCWTEKYEGPSSRFLDNAVADLRKANCPEDFLSDFVHISSGIPLPMDFDVIGRGRHSELRFEWRLREPDNLTHAWSQFVSGVADWYAAPRSTNTDEPSKPRDAERALTLYLVAWGADQDNATASVGLMSVFSPQQDRELFERYFDPVFKSIYYAKSEKYYVVRPQKRSDWESLVRFHTVLGTLLEYQREDPGNPENPRTPIGQWTLAIRAEEEVQKRSPQGFVGSHELYRGLAVCYQRMGDNHEAVNAWLISAERAIALEDIIHASSALNAIEALNGDRAQETRRATLIDRLHKLQNPVPVR